MIRPSEREIRALIAAGDRPFAYREVGATADPEAFARLADRYTLDRHRFPLGRGRPLFERACRALFAYRHFEIPWLELHGADEPVHADQIVATLARALGLWSLNPCRIVDRRDDPGDATEASFAYGTLEGHVARGEERFTLRRDPRTDEIEFEIVAFSRPALLLTRLGRPVLRRVQRRFAPAAAEALARACKSKSR
jgi:uncharacterized protein (UPF0548 family)